MLKSWFCLLAVGLLLSAFAETGLKIIPPGSLAAQELTDTSVTRKFNPVVCMGLSALLPGAGQFYTRHPLSGSFFVLAEVGTGIFGFSNLALVHDDRDSASHYRALVVPESDTTHRAEFNELTASSFDFSAQRVSLRGTHGLFWMGGIYVFGIMDALDRSRFFVNDKPKNPVIAGWLSAVPCLGLGQLYNGSLSRAGMIWMFQGTLAFMAYNYEQQMLDAQKQFALVADPKNPQYAFRNNAGIGLNAWDTRQSEAFRMRNTYLWYFLLSWVYGIFDAVVDAHLHDSNVQMRLEPDLNIQGAQPDMSLKLTWQF